MSIVRKHPLTQTRSDFGMLVTLILPLILSSLLESALVFTSSIFLAHLGPRALGAGSLVIWFFATLMVIVWGLMTAVSVLVARAYGANDISAVSRTLSTALQLAVLLTPPLTLLVWNMAPILRWLGQSPALVALAVPYLHALAFSVLPDLLGLVLLQFVIGLGKTRLNLVVSLIWVPLNIGLNALLTFGLLGLPRLGIAGLGIGATLTYWVTTAGLLSYLYSRREFHGYFQYWRAPFRLHDIREMLGVGVPLGMMFFVEVGFFFVLALIVGSFGTTALAANQVAVQGIGLFAAFMFPVAQGITVRMGHLLGHQEFAKAHSAAMMGVMVASGLGLVFAGLGWFAPAWLTHLDFSRQHPPSPELLSQLAHFLLWAGVFQLFESQRIALFGALRAYKDTRFTLMTSCVSFWGVALGVGFGFERVFHLGPDSYWIGFALSSIVGCAMLWLRYGIIRRAYSTESTASPNVT